MYDKYDVDYDPDCYPNTSVLKNKLGIKDEDLLANAERDFTWIRAENFEPCFEQFNFDYLKYIHKVLFQDLYSWAGQIRHVDIIKGQSRFCHMENIEREARRLFEALKQDKNLCGLDYKNFIEHIAHYYCELNIIHPFREGNGRAQRIFFEILAINAGYEIRWEGINLNEWVKANQAGYFCNLAPLEALFKRIIKPIDNPKTFEPHWTKSPR